MPDRAKAPTPPLPVDAYEDGMAALAAWHQRDFGTCFAILTETRNIGETAAACCALAAGLLQMFEDPDAVIRVLGAKVAGGARRGA